VAAVRGRLALGIARGAAVCDRLRVMVAVGCERRALKLFDLGVVADRVGDGRLQVGERLGRNPPSAIKAFSVVAKRAAPASFRPRW